MIHILNKFQPNPYQGMEVDTTSRGNNKDLSPFYLGPLQAWDGRIVQNVENYWQYSKVYKEHVIPPQSPLKANDPMFWEPHPHYFAWRNAGWSKKRADRYPMGKGAKPLYSYYNEYHLDYITARKQIYIPAYATCVIKTQSYRMLYDAVMAGQDIVLRDFDGYDYATMGMTLTEVVNNPKKTMGHAFVLAMLLTGTINECLK